MSKSSPDSPPPPPLIRYHPAGPVATEYRVGLCAWQDKSMIGEGSFYPIKSMKAEERLWWYSRFFDCVEVNSTFYAPLSAQNAVLWAKRTPPGFLFSVKAYALLTGHHLDAARLPPPLLGLVPARARPDADGRLDNAVFGEEAREWAFATFREALRPLAAADKLGYVLFQMAPWFKYGERAVEYLASLPARLSGVTIAVEFRDASWLPRHAEETLAVLRDRHLAYVSVDAPLTPASVDRTVALTAPTAILRLHGRNREGFMKQLRGEGPSVAEKYGYLYNREELSGIVARGRALDGQAQRVYFKLNNNVGDAPALNAEDIKELLGQETADRAAIEREWRARRRTRPEALPDPPESAC
ncbi:MAG TPA: DUF72 domain-containing protein [Methylomirabilota bacterium]|nr:DUF72 domain-containing protein [Methylomirabilota bacterium]